MSDGKFVIDTSFDTSGLDMGIKNATRSLINFGKKLAVMFGVGSMVAFAKQSIELASDLQEVDNVVSKSFGSMRGEMDALADTSIKSLGISRLTAYRTGSTFMSMGKSMLTSGEDAKNMALELTKLSANMSSFFNVRQDLTSIALKSIYTGETETLKQYGVVMTEVNLKQFALSQGITKSYNTMTQSEKVMLRYKYVMQQLGYIGDDFIDTQNSWANQTRILSEQWKEFMSIVGDGLVTVLTPVIRVLNQMVSALISASNSIRNFLSALGVKFESMKGSDSAIEDMTGAVEDYGDSIEEASKKAKKSLAPFDELNTLSKDASTSASSGGSGLTVDPYVPEEITNPEVDTTWIDEIREKLQPVIDAIERFKESLEPLKNFGSQALQDFYNNLLVPLGNWVLGEGLPRLIGVFTKFNNDIDWEHINTVLANFWSELEPFAENIGKGLLWFLENVLEPIASWTIGEVIPVFIEILTEGLRILNTVIEELKPTFQWLWDNFFSPLAQWVADKVVDGLELIRDKLKGITDEDIKTGLDAIKEKFKDIGDKAKKAKEFIEEHQTGIEMLGIAFGGLTTAIIAFNSAEAISNGLHALGVVALGVLTGEINIFSGVTALATTITSAFGTVMAFLTSPITLVILAITALIAVGVLLYKNWDEISAFCSVVWEAISMFISETVDNVERSINVFMDNVSKVWNETWQALSDIVSDIWNGIWGTIKKVINAILGGIEKFANGIVDAINIIVDAMNTLNFDIPDWIPVVGGKSLGFNLNQLNKVSIPRLATGTVIPRQQQQFMAMLGDNNRETEVVSPLSTIKDALVEALNETNINKNNDIYISADGDMNALIRLLNLKITNENNRMGRSFTKVVTV